MEIAAALPFTPGWVLHRIWRQAERVPPGGVFRVIALPTSAGYLQSLRIVVNDSAALVTMRMQGETIFSDDYAGMNTQGLSSMNPSGLPWLEDFDDGNTNYAMLWSPVNPLPFSSLEVDVQAGSSELTLRKAEGFAVEIVDADKFREGIADAFVPSVLIDHLDTLQALGWQTNPSNWSQQRLAKNGRKR